jgi:hypothetical protein
MSDITNYSTECSDLLEKIVDQCKDSEYMQTRLQLHLSNILPTTLATEHRVHEENAQRKIVLEQELKSFKTVFLVNNPYYYLPTSNTFYRYDGINYTNVTEDDIIYHLLSTISYDNTALMDWKHKTKISLIRKIKDRHLFKQLLPETKTIQKVLTALSPNYFLTRNEAKYFLTCIGDNILKKNTECTYYVSPASKQNLGNLDLLYAMIEGHANLTGNFITKYCDTVSLTNCRLIRMRNSSSLADNWFEMLKENAVNLLCVAAHYSNANTCADAFLEKREELRTYALFMKNNTPQQMVDKFCNECVTVGTDDAIVAHPKLKAVMTWRNVQYIWKRFRSDFALPRVVSNTTLKTLLIEKYTYDAETDTFPNLTSKHLPVVSDFMTFWGATMKPSATSNKLANDYEVDELSALFQAFLNENKETCMSNGRIVDDDILNILRYYYTDVEIAANKFILRMECSIWNKTSAVVSILESARIHFKSQLADCDDRTLAFDDIYAFYLKNRTAPFAMGKAYFEKCLNYLLKGYIAYTHVISEKWVDEVGHTDKTTPS